MPCKVLKRQPKYSCWIYASFLPSVEGSHLLSDYTVVECNCIALEGMALGIPELWHFDNLHSYPRTESKGWNKRAWGSIHRNVSVVLLSFLCLTLFSYTSFKIADYREIIIKTICFDTLFLRVESVKHVRVVFFKLICIIWAMSEFNTLNLSYDVIQNLVWDKNWRWFSTKYSKKRFALKNSSRGK